MAADQSVQTGGDGGRCRLEALGYEPQLSRALGFFSNFAVAFTYLSPMVGIYSLFILGVAAAGPAYVWLTWIPVVGMLFVALVFGELASHYPVAGALYQYSKFSVEPHTAGSWAVLRVRATDHGGRRRHGRGVVRDRAQPQLVRHEFGTRRITTTILIITVVLLAIQTTLNITGVKVMALVARFGVFVEIIGTLGIAIILAIHGFNTGLGSVLDRERPARRHEPARPRLQGPLAHPRGADRHSRARLHLLRIRVSGRHLRGDAGRGEEVSRVQCVTRSSGAAFASFILTASLLLAMPDTDPVKATVDGGGHPVHPLAALERHSGLSPRDHHLRLLLLRHVVQGGGSRLAFSFARDGALLRLDGSRRCTRGSALR